jgi:hypothetical protein
LSAASVVNHSESRATCTAVGFRSTPNRQRCATSAPKRNAIGGGYVSAVPLAIPDKRILHGLGQLGTRRDQKRTRFPMAGIDDPKTQDFTGGLGCYQRPQRLAHEHVR